MRVELEDEDARKRFTQLLQDGLSPLGADLAQQLAGGHVSVSGDDENLFVYADSPAQAEQAHAVILAELDHHGLTASTSAVEHWLADEERWDNEPPVEGWEEEVSDKGYAPGRCASRATPGTTRSGSSSSSKRRATARSASGST